MMLGQRFKTGCLRAVAGLLLGALALVLAAPVGASLIWEVRGEGQFLLGGTLHVLRPEDFPLPQPFEAAYGASERLILEADPAALAEPEMQQLLQQHGFMPPGESVESLLAADTWRRLQGFVLARELNLEFLQQMRPAMLAVALANIELARLGVTEMGIDAYFYQRARAEGRSLDELETARSQLQMLLALGQSDPDEYLLASLRDLERAPGLLDAAIQAWRAGDYERLFDTMVDPLREDHQRSYEALFVERHEAWMPHLQALAASATQELVLVGAGHLGGPDGLLRQLAEAGYQVRPWEPDQARD